MSCSLHIRIPRSKGKMLSVGYNDGLFALTIGSSVSCFIKLVSDEHGARPAAQLRRKVLFNTVEKCPPLIAFLFPTFQLGDYRSLRNQGPLSVGVCVCV